jgi:hypothetical protein
MTDRSGGLTRLLPGSPRLVYGYDLVSTPSCLRRPLCDLRLVSLPCSIAVCPLLHPCVGIMSGGGRTASPRAHPMTLCLFHRGMDQTLCRLDGRDAGASEANAASPLCAYSRPIAGRIARAYCATEASRGCAAPARRLGSRGAQVTRGIGPHFALPRAR